MFLTFSGTEGVCTSRAKKAERRARARHRQGSNYSHARKGKRFDYDRRQERGKSLLWGLLGGIKKGKPSHYGKRKILLERKEESVRPRKEKKGPRRCSIRRGRSILRWGKNRLRKWTPQDRKGLCVAPSLARRLAICKESLLGKEELLLLRRGGGTS